MEEDAIFRHRGPVFQDERRGGAVPQARTKPIGETDKHLLIQLGKLSAAQGGVEERAEVILSELRDPAVRLARCFSGTFAVIPETHCGSLPHIRVLGDGALQHLLQALGVSLLHNGREELVHLLFRKLAEVVELFVLLLRDLRLGCVDTEDASTVLARISFITPESVVRVKV